MDTDVYSNIIMIAEAHIELYNIKVEMIVFQIKQNIQ